jgi:O-antigen ligase
MLYLFFDLVRPSWVWHFPKIIAVIMVIAWIMKSGKVKSAQNVCFVLFVAVLAIDIVVAENEYAAVWFTYGMLMLLIGVCIPLINFTDTLPKLRHVVNALLGIFLYIALYAISHAGYGPAGEGGGQDENYVAAAMNLVIPLAYFSFQAEKTKWKKVCFASLVCLFIVAIVVGLSRGGLLGLLCALGYSVMKTPKKGFAISAAIALGGVLIFAGTTGFVKCNKYGTETTSGRSDCPSYWEHMSTMTETTEGTADLRLEFWQIATREFLSYPLTGVGGGNFKWRIAEFQSPEQIEKFGRLLAYEVHSTYFQLLAEMGLAGCIVFGLILLLTYRDYRHIESLSAKAAARAMERGDEASNEDFKWIQNYGRGLMGGLLGYLVSVAFLSALYYSHMWIAVSLMVALRMIATRRIGEDGSAIDLVEAKR